MKTIIINKMKSFISGQLRLTFAMLVFALMFSGQAGSTGITSFPVRDETGISTIVSADRTDLSTVPWSVFTGKQTQEPEDSLSKAEIRALKKEERALRKAQVRTEQNANRIVVDNPNNADYILLGKDLPRGRNVLDAISGRVPGMMISSSGYVTVHGPSSFYSGGTPLFLVDEIEVSREYATSLSIEDIDRIEIFTGPAAAIYGSRVGAGVISIFTIHSTNKAEKYE